MTLKDNNDGTFSIVAPCSFEKPTITKLDGKVVAVTMTDDEHRITEVLWEAPKPLSDEEIDEVSKAIWERPWLEKHREFARAIEERHGIK